MNIYESNAFRLKCQFQHLKRYTHYFIMHILQNTSNKTVYFIEKIGIIRYTIL